MGVSVRDVNEWRIVCLSLTFYLAPYLICHVKWVVFKLVIHVKNTVKKYIESFLSLKIKLFF